MLFSIFKNLPKVISRLGANKKGGARDCPICRNSIELHDSVDFNKSCEDFRSKPFPDCGMLVDYYLCKHCGYCFAPEFLQWPEERFSKEIYNEQYRLVDPDYEYARPTANANFIDELFGNSKSRIRHLDYGGGSGLLSRQLRDRGWDSSTFDPFVDGPEKIYELGKFDLITAFEVFEHVPDHSKLFTNLNYVAHSHSVILFSTLLSDGEVHPGQPLNWWYAAPRNGHVSLFSSKSLSIAFAEEGFILRSLNQGLHVTWQNRPEWIPSALHTSTR